MRYKILTSMFATGRERVARHSLRADARGYVVLDEAQRVLAACTRTRVNAFIAPAGFVSGTVLVYHALGSTAFVRISIVFGDASAKSVVANCVRPTGRWVALVYRNWFGLCKQIIALITNYFF